MSLRTTACTLFSLLAVSLASSAVHAEPGAANESDQREDASADSDPSADAPSGDDSSAGQQSEQSSEDSATTDEPPGKEKSRRDQNSSSAPNGENATGTGEADGGGQQARPNIPVDRPKERLSAAESAFQNGNFNEIPPLLEPILEPNSRLDSEEDEVRARELLGVGLYFEGQQATDADRRDQLMQKSRKQFLELLRLRPDYQLDSLIFPASVVELFESVRKQHADELEKIRERRAKQRQAPALGGKGSSNTLYIERSIERNVFAWNFFPGGIGQFQNGDTVKGTLFASGQVIAVVTNFFAYLQVVSLANPSGRYQTGGSASPFNRAYRWRYTQYASLGVFALLYGLSIYDGISNFQSKEVKIRTRDEPPPELSSSPSSPGNGPTLRIGLNHVRIRW